MPENTEKTLAERADIQGRKIALSADIICGGFPCQDISNAGKCAGISGGRSGLWKHLREAIRVVRPKYAIVENVAALLNRGISTVLGDLAEVGYDSEWHCIPASRVGANHRRDRVWIIAYPDSNGLQGTILGKQCYGAGQEKQEGGETTGTYGQDNWEDWETEPFFLGKNDDVPGWMDRVMALGNSVVPPIPEMIGMAIMEAEQRG